MSTIVRTPRPALYDMVNEFDNIFENLLGNPRGFTAPSVLRPAIDVTETETAYEIVADMPGVSRDDLEISIEEGVLSISTRKVDDTTADTTDAEDDTDTGETVTQARPATRTIVRERRVGTYARKIALADDVLEDSVEAGFSDGVLTLTLPKQPAVEPRKISVQVA